MLNNLKAEYVRKGIKPYKGVMDSLGCSEKTARNKLNETCYVTVPEAFKIKATDFSDDNFSIEYLFQSDSYTKSI